MNLARRGFLGLLAGAVLDPERLLWTPGKKLISIPAPRKIVWVNLYAPHSRIGSRLDSSVLPMHRTSPGSELYRVAFYADSPEYASVLKYLARPYVRNSPNFPLLDPLPNWTPEYQT